MSHLEPTILIVGAADTGRAPIAVALLRRLAQERGHAWQIASAGVVGHDDEPLQPMARDALAVFGMTDNNRTARSLTEELVNAADILIAVDSGIARVLRSRYPQANVTSLGELAGRARDIPDPAGMQIGAWLHYTREMESLLRAGYERLVALLHGEAAAPVAPAPSPSEPLAQPEAPAPSPPSARQVICERAIRLIDAIQAMPDVIDWPAARGRLQMTLTELTAHIADTTDLTALYVEALNLWLARQAGVPSGEQLSQLRTAIERGQRPVGQAEVIAVMRWGAGLSAE